mmetsp:Transcript_24001/g.23752  ORF Transcript_24001/g.23752 Transcript_24001/m.23752 type:complete len:98 (-) Transcript_24001:146-439(-)
MGTQYQHQLQHTSRQCPQDGKPCLFYGDIIRQFKESCNIPIVAYVVSGEYKMLYDYGQATGDMNAVVREAHISLVRAGATVLITYFAPFILDNLNRW